MVGFCAGRGAAGTGGIPGQTEIFATGVYTETLSVYNFDRHEILAASGGGIGCAGRREILPRLSRAVSTASRNPDQGRVVGNRFMGFEIPILGVIEPGGVPIDENKLRAMIVQIGMDVRPITNGGLMPGIKQMNNAGRPRQIFQFYPMLIGTGTVNEVIPAVMKKLGSVAAAWVAGTNPDGLAGINVRIRPPRHFMISWLIQCPRQVDVPR